MLLLLRSRGVVFTALITNTLRMTVQGKVMVLMMIMIIEPATNRTSASLSLMSEAFMKLAKEKFAMSKWELSPNELGVLEDLFLPDVYPPMKLEEDKCRWQSDPLFSW